MKEVKEVKEPKEPGQIADSKEANLPAASKESTESTETPTEAPEAWSRRLWRWTWQLAIFALVYLGLTAWMNRALLPAGGIAPAFALTSLDGKRVSLQQYKGRRVIIHFWATWCSACKMNMPMLRTIASQYRKDPVLLSIVLDGQRRDAVQQIAKSKKLNYPILLGGDALAKRYRIQRYPTTYFIDRKGRIASQDSGLITPIGFWWRGIWLWLVGHTR